MFARRPKFTPEQRLQLDRLVQDELEYLDQDAPVCMFNSEQEATDLLAVINANSTEG